MARDRRAGDEADHVLAEAHEIRPERRHQGRHDERGDGEAAGRREDEDCRKQDRGRDLDVDRTQTAVQRAVEPDALRAISTVPGADPVSSRPPSREGGRRTRLEQASTEDIVRRRHEQERPQPCRAAHVIGCERGRPEVGLALERQGEHEPAEDEEDDDGRVAVEQGEQAVHDEAPIPAPRRARKRGCGSSSRPTSKTREGMDRPRTTHAARPQQRTPGRWK